MHIKRNLCKVVGGEKKSGWLTEKKRLAEKKWWYIGWLVERAEYADRARLPRCLYSQIDGASVYNVH